MSEPAEIMEPTDPLSVIADLQGKLEQSDKARAGLYRELRHEREHRQQAEQALFDLNRQLDKYVQVMQAGPAGPVDIATLRHAAAMSVAANQQPVPVGE